MKIIKNVTLLNILSNLVLQVITIISGFIIPKIILNSFGSEVNGLIATLNQFLSYITLIEGGITGVVRATLYKPLVNNDYEKVSSVVKAADSFFKKIGIIFIVYTLILAIIYPLLSNSSFSYMYIFVLTCILGINLFIQYTFSLSLKTLLISDKKMYIVSFSQILIIALNIVLSLIIVKIYPNVHILKLMSGLLFVLQPLIYGKYISKNYKITKNVKLDKELLKNRWDGFAVNIAAFIHFSTDITILSLFTDLKTVSIYSVYTLVTNGLRQLIDSISSAINPTIGQIYAKGNVNDLNRKFNMYESLIFLLVFIVFIVAGLLITPFVMIYTKNITDANYYQPIFGVLIILSEAIYLLKFAHLGIAYSANKFKEISKACYIEAFLNIVSSFILVNFIGLIGIAIGTIIGMLYRMIYQVWFTSKEVISDRSQWIFYKKLLVFIISSLVGIGICLLVPKINYTIVSWIWHAVVYTIINVVIFIGTYIIMYKSESKSLIKFIRKRG